MKTTLAATLFAFASVLALPSWAQTATDAGAELKSLYEHTRTPEAKRAAVATELALTASEAKKFWPVYDAYQRRLDAANRRYARVFEDVVMSGRPISDDYAKNLSRELTQIEDDDARARKAMYAATIKALPGRKAIRYLQIENKLQAAYRYEIASTFPLVK